MSPESQFHCCRRHSCGFAALGAGEFQKRVEADFAVEFGLPFLVLQQILALFAMQSFENSLRLAKESQPVTADFTLIVRRKPATDSIESEAMDRGLPATMARVEREYLERAIRVHRGLTRTELAERLRISERALYKKLKQHGITG